jgi:protoporphyrinogen IX oxidase
LPRLFVYHADAPVGGELSEQFKVMERRLSGAIMWPAAVASWIFGLLTAVGGGFIPGLPGWLWLKLTLVGVLTVIHWILHRYVGEFAADRRVHNARYFRILNEIPTLILVGVVVVVILKPGV